MKQAGIVISIMAGVSLAELAMHAQHTRVVRIMPNMPVSIGAGMSVGIAHASVTDTTRAQIDDLWASTGALHWLEQESFMNAATAVSGCGPAYVFALIESLTDAAMAVGFDKATAYTLACHTVQGSARYAETSRATPTELMAEIASKGGVTEAALEVLRPELHTLMQRTITTAITRAEAITTPTGDSLN